MKLRLKVDALLFVGAIKVYNDLGHHIEIKGRKQ
jgi:hypothetical protein